MDSVHGGKVTDFFGAKRRISQAPGAVVTNLTASVAKRSITVLLRHMNTTDTRTESLIKRKELVSRGLALRCPNCGAKTLFKEHHYFRMNAACSRCGMRWDKDEAAFLGSTAINYAVTVFGFVLPWIVAGSLGGLSTKWVVGGAITLALLVPLALYRPAKSWWLMCYYFFFPNHLPKNWSGLGTDVPPDE